MSELEDQEVVRERATAIKHLTAAAFPADHLAPWMSIHDKNRLILLAATKTIGDGAIELDRRGWLDKNPDALYHPNDSAKMKLASLQRWVDFSKPPLEVAKIINEEIESIRVIVSKEDEGIEPEDFDRTRVRGANGMVGFFINSFYQNIHDLAPSEGGLGRRQAVGGIAAQKSGIAVEPKRRSLMDKILGRNKDQDKVGTGV